MRTTALVLICILGVTACQRKTQTVSSDVAPPPDPMLAGDPLSTPIDGYDPMQDAYLEPVDPMGEPPVFDDPDPIMMDPVTEPPVIDVAEPQTYVVQKGDTLWGIAKSLYGDGRRYKEIMQLNGISNPKKLYVGMELLLP